MATTPTTNPVPSEKPQDLKFNAGKIDEFVTSYAQWYVDRFGIQHYTIEGLKQLVLQQIYNLGWNLKGTFQGGGTVSSAGDLLQDTTTNIWYRWDGIASLPKTVPAGSTPASAGGIGPGKWQPVDVADVLRKDLAKPTGAGMIGAQDSDGDPRTVQEFLIANDSAEYRSKNISKLASVNYKIRMRQPISVLFQGDSMTAGYDIVTTDTVPPENGDTARHATTTYPERFVDFMLEQCGVTVTPVYRAMSGWTAYRAYTNAAWQINPNTDLVFLMYGINDAGGGDGQTHETFMQYMELLIRRFIKWGIGVVVLTNACGAQGSNNPVFQIWTEQVKNMAKIYGCQFFDAHEVQYNRLYGAVQSDNTHFNSMGYAKLGESLVSMCASGGLLETYQGVSQEIQMWPGQINNHIGFCNPQNNMVYSYSSAAYTIPGITASFPANQPTVGSFHFYQDCEALEFDIIGAWQDGALSCVAGNWFTNSGNFPFYGLSGQISNERSMGFKSSYSLGTLTAKDGAVTRGTPKFVGTLYGRGWKTITFFNALDGSTTTESYIQMLTLRPVPLRRANPNRRGYQLGSMGVTRQLIPDAVGSNSSVPAASTFPNVVLPMPEALKGRVRNNKVDFFDCGTARVTIKALGGTFGTHVIEFLIYRSTVNVDTFQSTILIQTGTAADYPVFSFTRTAKQQANNFTANQFGPGMPTRDMAFTANDVAFGSGRTDMGDWLTISADWSAVSGGSKTAYWDVEVIAQDFNGAPMSSAF